MKLKDKLRTHLQVRISTTARSRFCAAFWNPLRCNIISKPT